MFGLSCTYHFLTSILILLCFFNIYSEAHFYHSVVEPSGSCPPRGDCVLLRTAYSRKCKKNFHCRNSEICCPDDCSKYITVCKNPVNIVKETCPAKKPCTDADKNIKRAARVCTSDVHCERYEKCCEDDCLPATKTCKTSTKENLVPKTRYCPAKKICTPEVLRSRRVLCNEDSQCTGDEKCCEDDCIESAKSCKESVRTNPVPEQKYCPALKECTNAIKNERRILCTSDSQCSNTEKCCQDDCILSAQTCKKSVSVDPAPPVSYCPEKKTCTAAMQQSPRVICTKDSECESKEKCCLDDCYESVNTCKASVLTKPAEVKPVPRYCPAIKQCTAALRKEKRLICTPEFPCEGLQKCCQDDCFPKMNICKLSVTDKPVEDDQTKTTAENEEITTKKVEIQTTVDNSETKQSNIITAVTESPTRPSKPITEDSKNSVTPLNPTTETGE